MTGPRQAYSSTGAAPESIVACGAVAAAAALGDPGHLWQRPVRERPLGAGPLREGPRR